jgi:hypothetical protein
MSDTKQSCYLLADFGLLLRVFMDMSSLPSFGGLSNAIEPDQNPSSRASKHKSESKSVNWFTKLVKTLGISSGRRGPKERNHSL